MADVCNFNSLQPARLASFLSQTVYEVIVTVLWRVDDIFVTSFSELIIIRINQLFGTGQIYHAYFGSSEAN